MKKYIILLLCLLPYFGMAIAQNINGYIISIKSQKIIVDLNNQHVQVGDVLEVYNPETTITHPVTQKEIKVEQSYVGQLCVTAVTDNYSEAEPVDDTISKLLNPGQIVKVKKIVYLEMPKFYVRHGNLYSIGGIKVTKKNAYELIVDSDLYFKWRKARSIKKCSHFCFLTVPGLICHLNASRRMKNILKEYNSRDYSKVDLAYIEHQNQLKEAEFERRRIRDERTLAAINAFSQSLTQISSSLAANNGQQTSVEGSNENQSKRVKGIMCRSCKGTGKCGTCHGTGTYSNRYTGDLMVCGQCSATNGRICSVCNGTGYW